jgi:hypothetical protein
MTSGFDPASPLSGKDLSKVALRVFANIAGEWSLTEADQAAILGGRQPRPPLNSVEQSWSECP